MTACALFAKSPNWASQITSEVPAVPREKPYSNPSTAASLRPGPAPALCQGCEKGQDTAAGQQVHLDGADLSGEFHTSTASCSPGCMCARETRLARHAGPQQSATPERRRLFQQTHKEPRLAPVRQSYSTALRWLKVPRSLSCPLRRTAYAP